jgi:CRP/FNR family cyclic AMP-dependent transcriptional regulator
MQATADLLRKVPIFGGLRMDTLSFLFDRAAHVTFKAGDWIFREGEAGTTFLVLERGHVRVTTSAHGEDVYLAELGEADCVGEMALIAIQPRSASVQATCACSAVMLTNADLAALYSHDLEQFTIIMMNLGREVARRLNHANRLLLEHGITPGSDALDSG